MEKLRRASKDCVLETSLSVYARKVNDLPHLNENITCEAKIQVSTSHHNKLAD